ncbi:olfactory receptor 6B9-like [Discoglossus pictus]
MLIGNGSLVKVFILLAFPGAPPLQHFFFLLLLVTYIATLLSNFMIIIITWTERRLQTPMYYYLRNFSLLEVCYVSVIAPKILSTITTHGRLISYYNCIIQLYFFFFFASIECFLLGFMAFDRYLAICQPLRYPALMNIYMCRKLIICSWLGGFVTTFPPVLLISQLKFCRSNIINHFFCDAPPLLKLSCANSLIISVSNILGFISTSLVIITSFMMTSLSYIYIIVTVLKIPTAKARRKTFSTCGSHLIVVIVYYSTVTFMYVRPQLSFTFSLNRVLAVFYTVITPILNPIIYCLRNTEVKEAIKKSLSL